MTKVIKEILEFAMGTLAILIVSNQFPNLTILFDILFMVSGIAYIVYGALSEINKANKEFQERGFEAEHLSEQQMLIEEYIDKVMDFCSTLNGTFTIANQQDGLWVVKVNDETGMVTKICNLSLPAEQDITNDNIDGLISKTIDDIKVNFNQVEN